MTAHSADRALVEQWLAERIHAIQCGCDSDHYQYARDTAVAILDTQGVQVGPLWHPAGGRTFLVIWTPVEVGSPKPLPVEYRPGRAAVGEKP